LLAAGLLLLALAAACDYTTAPLSTEPQVTNNPDDFRLQVNNLNNVSGSLEYTWQNSGTVAAVTQTPGAGSFGTATITIRDNAGTQVYSRDLKQTGPFVSMPAGAAGSWTIHVDIEGFYGTIDVHVQKGN
jgi:hypothetical protein